ncbi:MAG TPA: hypothetical protein VII58_06445 [Acidobacteriaceae bacterium]
MEKTGYSLVFEKMELASVEDVQLTSADDYNEYSEIAELSRLAEALKEPEPHSFTIG